MTTGQARLSLDVTARASEGDEPVSIVRVQDMEGPLPVVAAALRAVADRLDPQPSKGSLPGHVPGCRGVETSVSGRTRDVGGHPEPLTTARTV